MLSSLLKALELKLCHLLIVCCRPPFLMAISCCLILTL